jgi:hypothetical protein
LWVYNQFFFLHLLSLLLQRISNLSTTKPLEQ